MTPKQLERFILLQISTEEGLIEFIDCVKNEVATHDEMLILGLAVDCSTDIWRRPSIQRKLKDVKFENNVINIACRLLGCSKITSELRDGLNSILTSQVSQGFEVTELLVQLHSEKIINAKETLAPLLHWYSPIRLWTTAIGTFRICEPSLLFDKKHMLVPSLRAAEFRVLLELLLYDAARDSNDSDLLLIKAVKSLHNLGSKKHRFVVRRIAQLCAKYNLGLLDPFRHEMLEQGDKMDIEYLSVACSKG